MVDQLPGKEHDLCDGKGIRMRDRQQRAARAHRLEAAACAAVELQSRRSTLANDFDSSPEHVLRMARAERFHRGFLRSKSSGKMNGRFTASHAVGDFPLREEPLDEAISVAGHGGGDARDVRGVDAETDDV